jgi:two-component system, sensor histidine kinase
MTETAGGAPKNGHVSDTNQSATKALGTNPLGANPLGGYELGFRIEQLHFWAASAKTTPPAVFLITLLLVGIAWTQVPVHWWLPWFLCANAVLVARLLYVQQKVIGRELSAADAANATQVINASSLANGVTMGASALLFLPSFAIEWQAVLTMLHTSLIAGAVPASACRKRNFDLYAAPTVAMLALAWCVWGKIEPSWVNYVIAFLLVVFYRVGSKFVGESEAMFRESWRIRFENKNLIAQLQEQQQGLKLERDRSEAANSAKSRFLAAASHDLRQPLHTVSLYSAALSLRPLDERARKLAAQISAGIASLASLLDSLLDISRLDSNSVEPHWEIVDLTQLGESVVEEFVSRAGQQNVSVSCTISNGLVARSDGLWLKRIIRNLAENALVHGAHSRIVISGDLQGTQARLVVTDDGPGIPSAEVDKVFEEFYQLHNPERDRSRGLGLGLSIVKRLSVLLGIRYAVRSTEGHGTSFEIWIPDARVERRARAELNPLATTENRQVSNVRLLLVDDEQSVREGMAALVLQWGCEFDCAAGLTEAIELLHQNLYDGIIVDYRLRGHDRGIELFEHPALQTINTRRLVISGDSSAEVQREIAKTGAELKLKPIDPQDLWRFVKSCEPQRAIDVPIIPVAKH